MLISSIIAMSITAGLPQAADADRFLLVQRSLEIESVRLVSLDADELVFGSPESGWDTVPVSACVALIGDRDATSSTDGVVRLADGQVFTGRAVSNPDGAQPDALVWEWADPAFERLIIPLDEIAMVGFAADATPPRPGDADVVQLRNGDRIEGLIASLGDPIVIEQEAGAELRPVEIRRDHVESVLLVTPPASAEGTRIWLTNGSIVNVERMELGDDGFVRLFGVPHAPGVDSIQLDLADIAAVLFSPDVMTPLSTLRPDSISGPLSRFRIPHPTVMNHAAPLGLSEIEFRGPLIARYALPRSPMRFVAEAILPPDARVRGDVELIVRDDDREVFRARLNQQTPRTAINVMLRGAELSIELHEAGNGPVDDRLILRRAMLAAE